MAQQVKEKLVRIDIVEKEQKTLNKRIKWEKVQAKMEEFLIRLNKERKSVKSNLRILFKKAELNANYCEHTVLIQEIGNQQVYMNNGIYWGFKRSFLI